MLTIIRNEKGIALLVTILVVSLLFGLTVHFQARMLSHLESATNLRDGVKLDYMAKSAFNAVRAVLRADAQDNKYDSFHDDWAKVDILSAGSSYFFKQGKMMASVDDYSGKIQINAMVKKLHDKDLPSENQITLLSNFLSLEEFGLEQDQVENIVDAIIDWLDSDDDVTGFGGAENSYYQALDPPYSCGNGPLVFVEDLLRIRGIDKNILYGADGHKGIIGFLTTFGNDGLININTAPPLILRAILQDLDKEEISAMIEYREDEENKGELASVDWYKKVPALPGDVTIPPNLITTKSSYFGVKTHGILNSMQRSIEGVVHRLPSNNTEIISWKKE